MSISVEEGMYSCLCCEEVLEKAGSLRGKPSLSALRQPCRMENCIT